MAKRRHKKKALPVRVGELATKERRHQNGGVTTEVIDRDSSGKAYIKHHKANEECVLDAYLRREYISLAEHEAGMKFRSAYLWAVLHVKVADSFNPFIDSGGTGSAENAMIGKIASERLLDAAYKVLSSSQKAIVIAVCGHDEWSRTTARRRTLHRGLERLTDLWKRGRYRTVTNNDE